VRIQGDVGQLLLIERSTLGDTGTASDEGLLLNITVNVGGYGAADQAWVEVADWRRFLTELRALERLRQGDATLVGARPGDLSVTFRAADRVGHMAVSGFVAWDTPDGFVQRLEFGFGFDAWMLQTVIPELAEIGQ